MALQSPQNGRIDQAPVSRDPAHAEGFRWNAVDLGPELPMPVFSSMEVWNPDRIGAVAIYCSDGRWGEAFDDFCHKRLQIPRYDRLAIPGGPACFVGGDADATAQCGAALEQLSFWSGRTNWIASFLSRITAAHTTQNGCAGRPMNVCLCS
jgi:hypothetical protein